MADTLYTQALARAAEIQGSTQALASLLRVPENTLLRWMSGRAQMPLQAFLKLLEVLAQYERSGGQATLEDTNGEPLSFSLGELAARCERTTRGDLIAQVARETIQKSRAMLAARARRQEKLFKKHPQLRPLNEGVKPKSPVDGAGG
jgi:hypothetical protein